MMRALCIDLLRRKNTDIEFAHFATNNSKSAHYGHVLRFSLHGYNGASVAAGNATTSKSTLRGYFHQYYVFLFFYFTA